MALTKEQFEALRSKGLSTEQIVAFDKGMTPEELGFERKKSSEGLASRIFRGITEPVVTLGVRPLQAVKAIMGDTPEQQAVTLPYYGKIKTAQTGKDIVKDIGRGVQTASLGLGGAGLSAGRTLFGQSVAKTVPKILQTPGVVQSVKAGLKGSIKEGVKSFAQTGLTTGTATGFGMGLEEAADKPPEDAFKTIFANTALGAVSGVAGGTVLGGITPVAAKGLIKIADYTKVPQLTQKISNVYKRTLNPTARQAKIDARFGNDSFNFLAQELPEMPLSVNKDGRVIADDALDMARQKYTAEATAFKPIIRNSGKFISIDDAVAKMKAMAKSELDGSDLKRAEAQIDSEVDSFLSQTDPNDVNVDVRGKRYISLARADDMKSYSWSRGKGWGTPEAELWSDVNNMIGHSLKNSIEGAIDYAPIKEMNRRLGQWKSAIDMLERRNGQVSGTGGKAARYIARSTGILSGGSAGFGDGDITDKLAGAGAGYMTANMLAALFANPKVRLFAIRALLKNLQKAGKMDMIKEAQQILQEQSVKYRLPAAGGSSYMEKPIILPSTMPKGATEREVSLGLNEVKGMNQSNPKYLDSAAPSAPPSIIPTIVSNIEKTIPKVEKKSSRVINRGGQEAAGGVAGIEIKKDENGKQTITFNKEKAIAGIIGMAAYKKLPKKVKTDAAIKLTEELQSNVAKAINDIDVIPTMTNKGLVMGNPDSAFLIEQLRAKMEKKALSEADILKAIPALKEQGIDVMKESVEKVVKFKQNKITGKMEGSTASKDLPLITEAKKYKSAEEFVKKQPVVYHGSATELKQFNNKQGTFFTDDMMNADGYAGGENVYEGYINFKNPLVIDAKGKLHRELSTPYGKTTREIVANVDSKKYDGVIFKNIKDSWIDDAEADTPSTIYYAFKPRDSFLNKSQLTDIWNKANKKK